MAVITTQVLGDLVNFFFFRGDWLRGALASALRLRCCFISYVQRSEQSSMGLLYHDSDFRCGVPDLASDRRVDHRRIDQVSAHSLHGGLSVLSRSWFTWDHLGKRDYGWVAHDWP